MKAFFVIILLGFGYDRAVTASRRLNLVKGFGEEFGGYIFRTRASFYEKTKISRCERLESLKTPNEIQCLAGAGCGEIDGLSYIASV